MNIYLVETLDSVGYDEYHAVVVFAKSAKSAKVLAKKTCYNFTDNIKHEYLGKANPKRKEEEILTSFNAG